MSKYLCNSYCGALMLMAVWQEGHLSGKKIPLTTIGFLS